MDAPINRGSLADNGYPEKTAAAQPSNWNDPLAPKPIEADAGSIPASAVLPVPLSGKVLVLIDEAAQQIGSIIVPDTNTAPPLSGLVVRVSESIPSAMGGTRPLTVQEGDVVYFERFNGTDLYIGGKGYKLLHNDDCSSRMPRVGEPQYEQFVQERTEKARRNEEARTKKDVFKNTPKNDLSRLGLQQG